MNREGKPTPSVLERVLDAAGVIRLVHWDAGRSPTLFGIMKMRAQCTWRMDQAFAGGHTMRLYGSFTSDQALVLTRYSAQGVLVDSAQWRSGGDEETIRPGILFCLQWARQQQYRGLPAAAGRQVGRRALGSETIEGVRARQSLEGQRGFEERILKAEHGFYSAVAPSSLLFLVRVRAVSRDLLQLKAES